MAYRIHRKSNRPKTIGDLIKLHPGIRHNCAKRKTATKNTKPNRYNIRPKKGVRRSGRWASLAAFKLLRGLKPAFSPSER